MEAGTARAVEVDGDVDAIRVAGPSTSRMTPRVTRPLGSYPMTPSTSTSTAVEPTKWPRWLQRFQAKRWPSLVPTTPPVPPPPKPCPCQRYYPPYDNSLHPVDRLLLASWLTFLEFILIILGGFYTWTYVNVGVPSYSIQWAYCLVAICWPCLFTLLLGGIFFMVKTKLGDDKPLCISFNSTLGLLLLVGLAWHFLFAQKVSRVDMLFFLTNKHHAGASTFVNYIHDRFNCCIVMSQAEFDESKYGFQSGGQNATTPSPLEVAANYTLCPQDGAHDISCLLGDEDTLQQLLAKDGESYLIYMLQAYLPSALFLLVVLLMILLNIYTAHLRSRKWAEKNKVSPLALRTKNFHDGSFAAVLCEEIVRYKDKMFVPGCSLAIPLPPPPPRPRPRNTDFETVVDVEPRPGPSRLAGRGGGCGRLRPCIFSRGAKEEIPMQNMKTRRKKKVTIVDVNGIYENEGFQESELI